MLRRCDDAELRGPSSWSSGCCITSYNPRLWTTFLILSFQSSKPHALLVIPPAVMESTKAQEFSRPHTLHLSTPAPEASPEQIRAYLSHVLITKRKLPEDYVRPVVARWQLGSGQELRSYSPAMYLRVFGHEDGWIIYREVMLAKLREDADAISMVQKNRRCKLGTIPSSLPPRASCRGREGPTSTRT